MFKKLSFIAICLVCISLPTTAQLNYKLTGSFGKNFSGQVYLIPAISDNKYFNKNGNIDSAVINNGKFIINRKVYGKEIYPYILLVKSKSINGETNMVLLSPRNETVIIDSVNQYISPRIIGSKVQDEMKSYYDYYVASLVNDINEMIAYETEINNKYAGNLPDSAIINLESKLQFLKIKGDSLFLAYSKSYPDSYVTLWKLIERFKNNGYKNEYQNEYNLLTKKIKNTQAADYLSKDLEASGATAIGQKFPEMELQTIDQKKIYLPVVNKKVQYTLVDFWFSACSPCIAQFPQLKRIFNDYKYAGFEMTGISVDSEKDRLKWINLIKEKNLPWVHYLDEGGLLSQKLAINFFPSNFLLDHNGKIIKRNISPSELEEFLAYNLKIRYNIQIENEPL